MVGGVDAFFFFVLFQGRNGEYVPRLVVTFRSLVAASDKNQKERAALLCPLPIDARVKLCVGAVVFLVFASLVVLFVCLVTVCTNVM